MKKVHVVAHSHWDHEWYFTMEDADIILIENLDYLIESLENDPEFASYSFDGQFSVIDKYLKLRPENKQRLGKLIREKRLFIGPWYTQTDSLLVRTEAVIRNLLYGVKLSKEMGHSMKIGYLPDIFGQHTYFPSFFKEFGIEHAVFQRGVYNDQIETDLNFIWKSPDNQDLKTNNIFFGYGPGKFLSAEDQYIENNLLPILERLKQMNQHTEQLLLPSGGDQVLIRRHFPAVVAELNEKVAGYQFELSDYEAYMQAAWQDGDFKRVIEGELLACQKSRIHHTCRSERYDIKQLNARLERKVIGILEPLAVIAEQAGFSYPKGWLDIMWKKIFDSQAHNGIGASNSDDANRDLVNRLISAERMADGWINICKKQIANAIGLDNTLVVFNTDAVPFTGIVQATIFTSSADVQIQDVSQNKINFTILKQERLAGGRSVQVTAKGEKEVTIADYYRTDLYLQAEDVPSMGYIAYQICEQSSPMDLLKREKATCIANEAFAISYQNGELILEDKSTGRKQTSFISFDDVADAGDSFDFSPLEGDETVAINQAELVSVEQSELVSKLTVHHTVCLPTDLEGRKEKNVTQSFTVVTCFELRKGEEFVRVHHEVDNECKDHRLRVLLQTGMNDLTTCYADQGYSLVERSVHNPYLVNWREDGFVEAPMPIYPLEQIVTVQEQDYRYTVVANSLKEYQVLPETGEIALTLFRSNGLLGRDNLAWRPGRASGINNKVVYTPDGQMLTKMTFDYAISLGTQDDSQLFRLAQQFEGHQEAYQLQKLNTFNERLDRFEIPLGNVELARQSSLFHNDNPAILMSTCKQSWDGKGVIIRFFNPTNQQQAFTFHSDQHAKVRQVTLEEEAIGGVPEKIGPKCYITIKVEFSS